MTENIWVIPQKSRKGLKTVPILKRGDVLSWRKARKAISGMERQAAEITPSESAFIHSIF